MAQAMREAIQATRDNDGVVSTNDEKGVTYVTFTTDVPLEAEGLIRDNWLINPSSAYTEELQLFKRD